MSRNYPIIYFTCAVLVIVCSADRVSLAQSIPPSTPSSTTSFLPVPSGPAIPVEPSVYNSPATSYPETNAGTNAYNFMPGAVLPPAERLIRQSLNHSIKVRSTLAQAR